MTFPNDSHRAIATRDVSTPGLPRALRALAILGALALAGCDPEAGSYDVRAFGAKPDDGLDDTAGLQLAISKAGADGGGIVFLPRGRLHIAGTLELGLADHITIQGVGVGATVLERTGTGPVFVVNVGARDQALADFEVTDGETAEQAPLFHAIDPWVRSEIRRVKWTGYRNGAWLDRFEVVRLDRLEMVAAGPFEGASIRVGKEAPEPQGANLTIRDTLIRGGGVGVHVLDADGVFMRNTDVGDVGFAGLAIVPTSRSHNHTIAGNYFDISGVASVLMGGAGTKSQITFADNWIASGRGVGVHVVDEGTYGRVSFTGGRLFNSFGAGMIVEARSVDLLLSGIEFETAGQECLRIATRPGQASALLTSSTFVDCGGGVAVRVLEGADRFIAAGNRSEDGAIVCDQPMPAGAVNWFSSSDGC